MQKNGTKKKLKSRNINMQKKGKNNLKKHAKKGKGSVVFFQIPLKSIVFSCATVLVI